MDYNVKLTGLLDHEKNLRDELKAAQDASNAKEITRIWPKIEQAEKDIADCRNVISTFEADAELASITDELKKAQENLMAAMPKIYGPDTLKCIDTETFGILQGAVKKLESDVAKRQQVLVNIVSDAELKKLELQLQSLKSSLKTATETEQYDTVATLATSIKAVIADIAARKEELGAGEGVDDVDDTEDTDTSDTDETDTTDDDDDEYVPLS